MNLSLNRSEDVDAPWLGQDLVEILREISASLGPSAQTVNLVIVDDTYIREINKEFRKIDRSTDVISFSYLDDVGPEEGDDLAGEVYVSGETVEREAKELGVTPEVHFLRVGVHGLLHVVGYDHEDERDATRMENEEQSILERHLTAAEIEVFFDGRE